MEKTQAETDLMERFRAGDHLAFREVFDRYYQKLCFFAYQLIRSTDQAEDVVAETMTKLWNRHQNFEQIMSVQSFLYVTTRNACLNLLQRESYRSEREKQLLRLLQNETDDDQAARLIKLDLLKSIYDQIELLPEKQKAAFKMYYFEDLSIDEIANKLNLSPQTIKANKFLALEKLRKIFSPKKGLISATFVISLLSCHYFFLIFFNFDLTFCVLNCFSK